MTYLDAAYQILEQAREPLHYQDITQRALAQGLVVPGGLTPEATMGSRLYTDSKQEGSRFVRAGKGYFKLVQWQPSTLDSQVQRINQQVREQLHDLLLSIPPERFEALITDLLIQMGFDERTVQKTSYARDGGIDVVGTLRAAGLTEVNVAVQVKRWKKNVGAPTVTQLRGSLQVHQQGIIITTSGFTRDAIAEANAASKSRISLIDGEQLLDLLIKHRVGVVEKHLTVTSLDEEWWAELLGKEVLAGTPIVAPDPSPPVVAPPAQKLSSKPVSFTLHGKRYPVASWKGLLVRVCYALSEQYGDAFGLQALTLKGKKRDYFSLTGEGMTAPAPIPGTGLWVETHFNAANVMKLVKQLLRMFGEELDELEVVS